MTKKSYARIERDMRRKELKKAKKDVAEIKWEDLEDIYQKNLIGLSQIGTFVPALEENIKYVEDTKYLETTLQQLTDDTTALKAELDTIHDIHKGKVGAADLDNVMDIINIFETYNTWFQRFLGVIEPTQDVLIDLDYLAKVEKAKEEGTDATNISKLPTFREMLTE